MGPPCSSALVLLICWARASEAANCVEHNYCNSHGVCSTSDSTCECFDGYGSVSDISLYKRPDCGNRAFVRPGALFQISRCMACYGLVYFSLYTFAGVCPAGRAWADVPTGTKTAHAMSECSNKGLCERSSGVCQCFEGFAGDACQRFGYAMLCICSHNSLLI